MRENEAQKYKKKARVLPIVVGATGAMPKATRANVNQILQNPPRIEIIQKLVALETIAVINAAV